jgi:hypothetical protein
MDVLDLVALCAAHFTEILEWGGRGGDFGGPAVEPECVFVYGGWEERGFGVDLLAGLEESGADSCGLDVAWAVVEGVAAIERCW